VSARAQLEIAAGFATRTGTRSGNQDFGLVDLGTASQKAVRGIIVAVADGAGSDSIDINGRCRPMAVLTLCCE
jgi:hypothetical protein